MIDADQFIANKQKDYTNMAHTIKEAQRIREYLVSFGIEPNGVWEGSQELKEKLSAFTEACRS